MTGPNVGFATLSVIPSMRGFSAKLNQETSSPLAAAGKTGGGKFSAAFATAAKVGMAGVGTALGAVAGLAKLGESFDGAFDTIRTGTGATGKALEGLQEDFKKTFSAVPVSMDDASVAIADLNTRLGLTGKPLQDLSVQMLNLSRLTGTDVGGNVANITRVFGDWGTKTEDQAAAMDQLFRASQSTGAGIDQLAQGVVKFGAPLRQLGFGFEESLAMLGKFEKEGVNTDLVIGSMRVALGKLAKAGEPAQETFERVTNEIKNAGSTSEANAKALALFGARAGPDMAAAIREGRFELDEMTKTIASGGDTINGVAGDTDDWREKLRVLGNRAMVALEPLASKVFGAIGRSIEWVTPHVERLALWMGENLPKAAAAAGQFVDSMRGRLQAVGDFLVKHRAPIAAFVGVIGGFVIFQKVAAMVQASAVAFRALTVAMASNPAVLVAMGIAALVAGLVLAYQKVGWFRDAVDAFAAAVRTAITRWFLPAVAWIWRGLQTAWTKAQPILRRVWAIVQWVVDKVVWYFKNVWWRGVQMLAQAYIKAWSVAQPILQKVWSVARWLVDKVVWYFTNVWWPGVQVLWSALKAAWDLAQPIIRTVWSKIKERIDDISALFSNVLKPAFDSMVDIFQGAWDVAKPVIDTIGSVIGGMVNGISGAFNAARSAVVSGWNSIASAWNSSVGALSFTIPDWIPGFGGKGFDMPNLPTISTGSSSSSGSLQYFHSGGLVRGRPGEEVPAMLLAGEYVLTGAQFARMQGQRIDEQSTPSVGQTIGLNIENINVADSRDLRRELASIEWERRAVPKAWSRAGR